MTKPDGGGFAKDRSDLSPQTQSVWLPAGTPRVITLEPAAAECVGVSSDGARVAVEIAFDAAGDVVARIDGEVLGEFDSAASAELSPSLRMMESRGLIALAHGVYSTADGTPTVTVYADALGGGPVTAVAPVNAENDLPEDEDGDDGAGAGAAVAAGTATAAGASAANTYFAADAEAEAAALAADQEADALRSSSRVRLLPERMGTNTPAIVALSLALGVVGAISYYAGTGQQGQEMNAFMGSDNTTASTGPSLPTRASFEKPAPPESSKPEEPSEDPDKDPAADEGANVHPAPQPGSPAPVPQSPSGNDYNNQYVAPPAPPPAPAPAQPPAPAPAPPPPPPRELTPEERGGKPLFEIEW